MKYIVKAQDQGMTLEDLLKERLHISNRLYQRLAGHSGITVEAQTDSGSGLGMGDIITIRFDYEKNTYEGQPGPLEIVYEDEDLLVINKDPYVVVHPTRNILEDTLINHLSYYLYQKKDFSKLRFVSRLDRDTSGAVLVAKNPWMHHRLSTLIPGETLVKEYTALVHGSFKKTRGLIDLPIGPLEDGIHHGVTSHGRDARTGFEVIEDFGEFTLLHLRLYTGRTHQIRVHLAHIGHPVVGDTLYQKASGLIQRQFLHASRLDFVHPVTGAWLKLEAPLKADLKRVLETLKGE
ncbi:MAG: hypothetical protein AVO33_07210 [delta proteobacterium ML8_F1]|nr:MAG: hypothetical protein AVO33_07210 [delta proteobacterium ML8_F1]